jgi:hypothetical protein
MQSSSCFVDHKTDSVIQSTMRNELGTDVTILTVAHRLQTIMDADKIVCPFTMLNYNTLILLFRWCSIAVKLSVSIFIYSDLNIY